VLLGKHATQMQGDSIIRIIDSIALDAAEQEENHDDDKHQSYPS
jgi:hypothetical protein